MNLEYLYIILILASVLIALLWSIYNAYVILSVNLKQGSENSKDLLEKLTDEETKLSTENENKMEKIMDIGSKIANGANTFLYQEYKIMCIFIILFGAIICFVVDYLGNQEKKFRFYTTGSFIIGSLASILCGFIGMRIAVAANYRTTFKAMSSLEEAFKLSYRAGCVMGFSSVGIGLGLLLGLILVYVKIFEPVLDINSPRSYAVLMEMLAGYGLGGSSMALFGRVGGGIYTKAADVGADLVGKLEAGFEEDSPKNPATIADNVGDNVGDIAGMGSDLFGSFAESTCAALVIIANTPDLIKAEGTLYFPLLISTGGIIGCFFTSIFGIYFFKVNTFKRIALALNLQLLISTLVTLVFIYFSTWSLPDKWVQGEDSSEVTSLYCFICAGMGLVSGFLIGMSTDYYTSNAYKPVREVASASSSGSAINIIYGLALGYLSTIIPIFLLAFTVLLSLNLLGMFGVALAAIGMLSTLAVGLAIDAYGPICDNAGGISEMSELGPEIRKITDALDAAGNTTAAVGKGFAIGSAALVSIALYGAFLTRAQKTENNPIKDLKITNPWIYAMMLIGAMLPYAFSALTMKSVGLAASEMVTEVRRQLKENEEGAEPDYDSCIAVSTKASIREMILPGILVMFTPLFFGILFHPILIAGLLPGALLSGVQLAISMSNTGGAWDNTKKYIESGEYINAEGEVRGKGTLEHEAAITGDTVGDPLKDTSGPSLNILIKLMAIISLVFAEGFAETSFLAPYLNIEQ